MKKTKNFSVRGTTIIACIYLVICVSAGLLFFEYRKIKKTTQRCIALKNDYRLYTATLRRLIQDKEQEKSERVKKKSIIELPYDDTERVSFNLVNRDPDYLRTQAVAFAKYHNLAEAVDKMFVMGSWDDLPVVKLFPGKKKRKKQAYISGISTYSKRCSFEDKKKYQDMDFIWPLEKKSFWFSSPFGPRKLKNAQWKFHYGVDLAALRGTPIKASASGVVIQSEWHRGYGNCITIMHNKKYKTRYAHLDRRHVQVGQKIRQGSVIGTVGATGFVKKIGKDASHLHFEVYSFGRHINPMLVLA